jgi:regulator of replication initiation timing
MTENLLENLVYKLEEKMMMLLTEIEDARREIQRLSQANSLLEIERDNHSKKLKDLLSLLDTVGSATDHFVSNMSAATMKPVLIQDKVNDRIA